ncbi:MAG: zinc-ribbon domain-containing protein [Gammaproteobacteria bacterium]|nr:zinc-ribbon domain-containing protein [Gammaproteobacteria bacterium]
MYTQCPACLTTFKITTAQLKAHDGMVRCGICTAVFHAEQRLLQIPANTSPPASVEVDAQTTSKKTKRGRGAKNKNAALKRRAQNTRPAEATPLDIPVVSTEEIFVQAPRRHWAATSWSLGILSFMLLFIGQLFFFYHDELGRIPAWRPLMLQFCQLARCELLPLQDVGQIELLQTSIAPHPKYENALRIRTTLVNRAGFAQTYPNVEVSLTNNAGNVIARRSFLPAQYLETPTMALLTPNVVANSVIDVTNPDGKAVGYEIRPVTP